MNSFAQITSSTTNNPSDAAEQVDDQPGTAFTVMLEYGFLPKLEGVNGNNFTYAFTAGANYYFIHRDAGLFAGARIGYNSANYNAMIKTGQASYTNITSEAHFITLPINAGYSLATANRKFAITPLAGIDVNFCVGGKNKVKNIGHNSNSQETKFAKKVGFDARVGAQLRIYSFNVGASYVIPLNDNQKAYFGEDSYVAINIGYGF